MLATFVSLQASATKPALLLSSGYPWYISSSPLPSSPSLNSLPFSLYSPPASLFYLFILLHMFRWLGEKYDGVRCVWHPSKLQLYPNILYIYTFIFLKKGRKKKKSKRNKKKEKKKTRDLLHSLVSERYTRHRFEIHLQPSLRQQLSSISYFDGEIWYDMI